MACKREPTPSSRKLFRTSGQMNFLEAPSLEEELAESGFDEGNGAGESGPRARKRQVERLGTTFESDDARRSTSQRSSARS